MEDKKFGVVGLIGRFKPLHKGAAVLLESVCESANKAVIGIGSSNKYNIRNPFTPEETSEMIDSLLSPKFSNYNILHIPDFGHIPEYADGKKWKEYVVEHFGSLDKFVSGNDYVRSLLKDSYDLIYPHEVVPKDKWIKLRATEVRLRIARSDNWEALVPESVEAYIKNKGLDERFCKEFGLQTLAELAGNESYLSDESLDEEKKHVGEV